MAHPRWRLTGTIQSMSRTVSRLARRACSVIGSGPSDFRSRNEGSAVTVETPGNRKQRTRRRRIFSLTAALTITETETENKPWPDEKRSHDSADTVCVDNGKVRRGS